MTYVQFYQNSTGYIAGSIPPRFSDANIKPIPMCGSDGVYILDGRNNFDNMIFDAEMRMEKMRTIHTYIIGYKIIKAQSLLDTGTILFSNINTVTNNRRIRTPKKNK
jgi:hypothetical protein